MSGTLKNILMLIATVVVGFLLYETYQGQPLALPRWVQELTTQENDSSARSLRSDLEALYRKVSAPLDQGETVSDQHISDWMNACESGYREGRYSHETATAGWRLCQNLQRLNAERRARLSEKERLANPAARVLPRPNQRKTSDQNAARWAQRPDQLWEQYLEQARPQCERYLDALD